MGPQREAVQEANMQSVSYLVTEAQYLEMQLFRAPLPPSPSKREHADTQAPRGVQHPQPLLESATANERGMASEVRVGPEQSAHWGLFIVFCQRRKCKER